MAGVELSQPEADALLAMPKRRTDDTERVFPGPKVHAAIPLESEDRREAFILDLVYARRAALAVTYQTRARQVLVLARLDLRGPPHKNPGPDGVRLPCPHLHRYREGLGDKWAEPAPPDAFPDTQDIFKALDDFMRYCNSTVRAFLKVRWCQCRSV